MRERKPSPPKTLLLWEKNSQQAEEREGQNAFLHICARNRAGGRAPGWDGEGRLKRRDRAFCSWHVSVS